jgi:hypothetical protein
MKVKTLSTRYVLTFAFAVLTAVILVGAVGRRRMTLTRSAGASNQQEEQRVQTPVPSVISEVKELKIAQVFVDDQKQLIIVLLNKTGKGVQSFAVSSGNFMVITDDGLISDQPKTIIEPNKRYTIQLPVSDLEDEMPVVISAVLYDDGTEDGDQGVRQKMREARRREKEKRLSPSNDNRER